MRSLRAEGGKSPASVQKKIRVVPCKPDPLGAAGEDAAELHHRVVVEELLRDTGHEHRLGLRKPRVLLRHEEVLAKDNVVGVFAADEVEDPDCRKGKKSEPPFGLRRGRAGPTGEEPDENEMRCITRLLG